MIFVSTARPMGNDPEYDRNQLAAKASWEQVADAIVYLNHPQKALASPITRFLPWEPFPYLIDAVNLCADQPEWSCIINADIVVTPNFKRIEQKLKAKKAIAASSWRWTFDPAQGIEPCAHDDNGIDFFAGSPGAWELLYQAMLKPSPRGDEDSPRHLKLGAPSWDSWCLGAFSFLFSNLGFYDLTNTKIIRHPRHGGRKHGAGVPPVHFLSWPVMGASFL